MSGYTSQKAIKEMGNTSFQDRTENPWSKYYGQPPYYSADMLDPEAKKLTAAPDLPAAYIGQNYYIPGLVEELVGTTDNWYTQIALPLRYTDQITYAMNVTTFDQRLPRNTPHKATSRILNSRSTNKYGKLERHGIMYEMEANFMDTAAGKEHYAFTLNQMANAVVMLLNVGVINAYLEADTYQRKWEESHGMRVAHDIILKMEREIDMFAIIQKEKHGLKKLDAKVTEWMTAYQGTANMWIFPPMIKMYNDLVPPENTEYYRTGDRGPANVDDSTTVQFKLNGNRVYLSRMNDDVTEFGQRNLLARNVQIGGFHTLVDVHKDESNDYFSKRYATAHRTAVIYNEDTDENEKVGIKFAIDNCYAFDERSGLPTMPKNSRLYSTNPGDRDRDMFSYKDDDNPSIRKPVTLFGHMAEEHFGIPSVINLCRTVTKYHSSGGSKSVKDMEEIFNAGMALVQKINSTPVTLTWLWNVTFEHWKRHGVIGNENMRDAAAYKAYVKKITRQAKRASQSMRVLKGISTNGMSLPEYDYYTALKTLNETDNNDKNLDAILKAPNKLPGGSSEGSLAGFGSWDGLLALQAELNSGPSVNSGFTKNGYLIDDCQTADRFVTAIKHLTQTLSFLFDNNVFLNKNKASSVVDDPTPEHALAEWLLGLTGIPVFLDVTKITALKASSNDRGIQGHDAGNTTLNEEMTIFVKDADKQNAAAYASIVQFVQESVAPKDKTASDLLLKKLAFYFAPVTATAFRAANDGSASSFGTDDFRAGYDSDVGKFLNAVFPLSNLNAQLLTNEAFAMRSIVLELINTYIVANKKLNSEAKKGFLTSFLNYLGKLSRLEAREALIPDVNAFKNAANGLTLAGGSGAVVQLPAGNGGTQWFDPSDYAPVSFEAVADWFVQQQRNLKLSSGVNSALREKSAALSGAQSADGDAFEATKANGDRANRSPVIFMMGVGIDENPATTMATRQGTGPRNFPRGDQGKGLLIGAQFGDELEEENFFDRGAGQEVYAGERFFRSTLVFSAKQAMRALELLKVDRTLDSIMNFRLADPSNIDRYLDPSRSKDLAAKIRDINNNAQENFLTPGANDTASFASAYESPLLFFPENVHLKERALALAAFGKGRREAFLTTDARGGPLNSKRSRSQKSQLNTMGSRSDARPAKRQRVSYGLHELTNRDDRDLGGDDDDYYGSSSSGEDYEFPSVRRGGNAGKGGGSYGRGGGGKGSRNRGFEMEEEYDSDDEPQSSYGGGRFSSSSSSNLGLLRKQMGGSNDGADINSNILMSFIKLGEATSSKLLVTIAKVYLTSYFNKQTLLKFCAHDILVPLGALLFRPHMTYESNAGIKTLAGETTGVTLVGHTGLSLQNDAATKTHIGHFTLYDSSIIIRESQVFVQRNIFISRCLGGAGLNPIDPNIYNTRTGETGGGSVIPVLIPYEETEFANIIDVTGRFEAASTMNIVNGAQLATSGYSQNWRANQVWRFKGADQVGADDIGHDDQSGRAPVNTVVCRGQQYNFSLATSNFTDMIINKGHWGREGPGSKAGRNGGLHSLVEHPRVQLV